MVGGATPPCLKYDPPRVATRQNTGGPRSSEAKSPRTRKVDLPDLDGMAKLAPGERMRLCLGVPLACSASLANLACEAPLAGGEGKVATKYPSTLRCIGDGRVERGNERLDEHRVTTSVFQTGAQTGRILGRWPPRAKIGQRMPEVPLVMWSSCGARHAYPLGTRPWPRSGGDGPGIWPDRKAD